MFGIEERLEKKGVPVEEMVAAALLLYVPHGLSADDAGGRIRAMIRKYLDDPNISSLLLGAVLLEEELFSGEKPEMTGDPVFLLADEIIGMAIAECIGGTYARFEFTRYDQKKPGVLSRLGPFLDDAVAGLIAGCTSRLYSECC
jgi:alpha-ribazole phosphatase CobZ